MSTNSNSQHRVSAPLVPGILCITPHSLLSQSMMHEGICPVMLVCLALF